MLWVFTAPASRLTATGITLFLNAVAHLHPLIPPPDPTHTIMNNIIANNTGMGIFYYVFAAYDAEILYNDVWGNSFRNYHNNDIGASVVPQPGTGEISQDPLFADAAHPGACSTTILTGRGTTWELTPALGRSKAAVGSLAVVLSLRA